MKIRRINLIVSEDKRMPEKTYGISGMDGNDAYMVINDNESETRKAATFLHEMLHIWHNDYDTDMDASRLEAIRHRELVELLDLLARDQIELTKRKQA